MMLLQRNLLLLLLPLAIASGYTACTLMVNVTTPEATVRLT